MQANLFYFLFPYSPPSLYHILAQTAVTKDAGLNFSDTEIIKVLKVCKCTNLYIFTVYQIL